MHLTELDSDIHVDNVEPVMKMRVYLIWTGVLIVAIALNIFRYPGFSILSLVGSAGLYAYALNNVLKAQERNIYGIICSVFGTIWTTYIILDTLISETNLYSLAGLTVYAVVFTIYFLAYFIWIYFRSKKNNSK